MGKAHGRAVTRWWKGAGPARVISRSQTNATHQDPHGQQDPLTGHGQTPQEPRQCGRKRPQARRTNRTQEMGKEGHKKLALPTQSIVTLKRPRRQMLRQHHGYWGLDDMKEPSDNPPRKERSAYNCINVVEVRETLEPQKPRSRERIQVEVVQKEAPYAVEVTMHKSRRKYYSRGSVQTPRPTEEPRGQEGQVQHPGNREKQRIC